MSSLTKITLTGNVVKNPEKRFTDDNLAICSFSLNFGEEGQEKLTRVFAVGKLADRVCDTVKKGQTVLVEGKLQTNVKNESGVEKKYVEINAQGIEVLGQSSEQSYDQNNDNNSSYDSSEINNEDLIGEDEIPF